MLNDQHFQVLSLILITPKEKSKASTKPFRRHLRVTFSTRYKKEKRRTRKIFTNIPLLRLLLPPSIPPINQTAAAPVVQIALSAKREEKEEEEEESDKAIDGTHMGKEEEEEEEHGTRLS